MRTTFAAIMCCLAITPLLFSQKKEDERLENSVTVLQAIVSDKGLDKHILNQAHCVLIFPSVKKIAIGIGGSYGRGVLVCRKGNDMKGRWGAPVMYSLDQGSVGAQFGSTATDFVLVVMSQKGVDEILNGKMKLGTNAAAAAGPTGAQATSYNAESMNVDVLTYSQSKGLFAGVSLSGATLDTDADANRKLYGKEIGASEIVRGNTSVVSAARPLVALLNKDSPVAQ